MIKKNRLNCKMKVCCYCEVWGSGGIEAFWINLIEHLDLNMYDIDVVVAKKLSRFYDSRLEKLGIRLIELSGDKNNYKANYRQLKGLFQTMHYDIVHINVYQALTLLYAECARRCGIRKVVAHSHCSALNGSIGYIPKIMVHAISKYLFSNSVSVCLACSESARKFMFPKGKDVSIIPNGIDIQRFRFSQEKREFVRNQMGVENTIVVGMVGRLCKEKNQEFGIKIFAELVKIHPNAKMLIVGEGKQKQYLQSIVQKRGLNNSVLFYGVSQQVNNLIQGMDVLLMPSKVEGFGLVAVEAQISGLPIVCSNCVPEEVKLSKKLVSSLSLRTEPIQWANKLMEMSRMENREQTSLTIDIKYDIQNITEKIEEIWSCE